VTVARAAVRAVAVAAAIGALAPAGAAPAQVAISDFSFAPATVTIKAGGRVDWTYALGDGTAPHTVTADDGAFDSDNVAPGGSFSHTFDKTGTYPYYCRFHGEPGGVGMAGVVRVKGPGSTGTPVASDTPATTPAPTGAPDDEATKRSGGRRSGTALATESQTDAPSTEAAASDAPVAARVEDDESSGVPGGLVALAAAAILVAAGFGVRRVAGMRGR